MTQSIKILINGAAGKMGIEAVRAVENEADLILVGKLGRHDNLAQAIVDTGAQVVVDLTTAESAYFNASIIIEHNVHPVIGTTGMHLTQIKALQNLCFDKKLGGIIAPNFSLGAVLLMILAKQAAHFFPQCEIIEMHNAHKKDSPSGTAMKTAEYIQAQPHAVTNTLETLKGARGAQHHNIKIHSLRLPGLVAHQEVIFGGHHESLTIRHDTFNRSAYMPGVLLSIRKVMELQELVYGLEEIMGL